MSRQKQNFTCRPKQTMLRNKASIHQVTTMLSTSKNVLFSELASAQAIIKVLGHQNQWLAGGYDLEIGHFSKWLA